MAPTTPSRSASNSRRKLLLSAIDFHVTILNFIMCLLRSRSSMNFGPIHKVQLSVMEMCIIYAGSFLSSHRQPSVWCYPRKSSWFYTSVMEFYDDQMWIENFRMTKQTIFELSDILRPYLLRKDTVMRSAVPVLERIAIGVYLSSKTCLCTLGNIFGRGKSTVGSIVLEFCFCIEHVLLRTEVRPSNFIKMSRTFSKHGMISCVGAVDGSHIAICCPKLQNNQYYNRKSYYSVLLQAACDGDGIFFSMLTGHSGVNHDAYVLRSSRLYEMMEDGTFIPGGHNFNYDGVNIPPIILGDAAYPLRKWLMKPFLIPENEIQQHYNKIFNRSRNVIERAFGRLKARFRRLAVRIEAKIENINSIIAAAVVLHNICEKKKHEIPDSENVEAYNNNENALLVSNRYSGTSDIEDRREGEKTRAAIANYLYYHGLNSD